MDTLQIIWKSSKDKNTLKHTKTSSNEKHILQHIKSSSIESTTYSTHCSTLRTVPFRNTSYSTHRTVLMIKTPCSKYRTAPLRSILCSTNRTVLMRRTLQHRSFNEKHNLHHTYCRTVLLVKFVFQNTKRAVLMLIVNVEKGSTETEKT